MSVKAVQFVVVCVFGLAIGAGFYFARPQLKSPPPPRNPAAQWAGKHSSPFQITISAPKGIPPHEGADLELLAQIKVQQTFNEDIEFNWILPPGVRLVDGDLQDSVSGLQAGQNFERKLVVQGYSKGDASQIIVLQISSEDNGVRVGSAGVFKEASFEPSLAGGVAADGKSKSRPLPKSVQQ